MALYDPPPYLFYYPNMGFCKTIMCCSPHYHISRVIRSHILPTVTISSCCGYGKNKTFKGNCNDDLKCIKNKCGKTGEKIVNTLG